MEREIKFRVWDGETMIYDDHKNNRGRTLGFVLSRYENNVMQFTGIIDIKGKEVYDKDIYQVNNNLIYEVFWMTKDKCGESVATWGLRDIVDNYQFPIDDFAIKNGIVLGNIYENQELI